MGRLQGVGVPKTNSGLGYGGYTLGSGKESTP